MKKLREPYTTRIHDTQWALIEQYMPKKKNTGAPRRHPWRSIMDGIFYLVKNGCVWRDLPAEFPYWKTVYHYFRQFRHTGVWEKINQCLREQVRKAIGREERASAMIIDSQSIKTAEGGEQRGFDGGKKINGRKRNLIVDTEGLLVVVKVTAASVQDVHAGQQTLEELHKRPDLWMRLAIIFADGGYRGDLVAWVKLNLHALLEIVLKPEGQKGFQVLPKRWVIERTNAWITRNRRLARDYERTTASSEAFIYIAMIRHSLNRLARIQAQV